MVFGLRFSLFLWLGVFSFLVCPGQGYEDVEALRKYIDRGETTDAKRILARIQTQAPPMLFELLPEAETLYALDAAGEGDRVALLGIYETILQDTALWMDHRKQVVLKRVLLVGTMTQLDREARIAIFSESYSVLGGEMPAYLIVDWGKQLLESESWDKVILWFGRLTLELEAIPEYEGTPQIDLRGLQTFFRKEIAPVLPLCSQLGGIADSLRQSGGMKVPQAQALLLLMTVKMCDEKGLLAEIRHVLEGDPTPFSYRLLVLIATNYGNRTDAIAALRKYIGAEPDEMRKVKARIDLADLWVEEEKYLEASRQLDSCLAFLPQYGEIWYSYGGLAEEAAGQCGESDFDRKALYWLAEEFYLEAKNRDASIGPFADMALFRVGQLAPTEDEYRFHGLNVGDSYPLKCLGNRVTHVR